jgi:glutamyl-tRNA synthetase
MTGSVRTRIAPAPSGYIHVGNARTALYNWLLARRHDGVFVVRIEDTDRTRTTEEGYRGVLEDLRWLGLDWDEGPEIGGDFGPYRQSERFDRYRAAATQLLDAGRAYRCYCTPEELAARRAAARGAGGTPGYDGHCRDLSDAERAAYEREGRAFALRFRVPEGRTIAFDDVVRGSVVTDSAQIADFVVLRSDSSPTYVLAAGLDDALMGITHIVRGEDLIAATPRQLLLREALGIADVPVFAHLPLLVDDSKRPLSKRWGDVSVRAYRERGFLPQAMVNYLALLGWSYDDRTNIFSRAELIDAFSLERVARNPAAFDVAKLEWLNLHYIKQMSPDDLAGALVPFCELAGLGIDGDSGLRKLRAVAPFLVERLKRLDEAPSMVRFLFDDVQPDDKAAKALAGRELYLEEVRAALGALDHWSSGAIEGALRGLADERGLKPKQAFQPIRAAVTGTLVSPPLFESLEILGREATLERLAAAAQRL